MSWSDSAGKATAAMGDSARAWLVRPAVAMGRGSSGKRNCVPPASRYGAV